jgi:sortase A
MRQIFANRRLVGLLALGVVVLLVAILAILGARVLLGGTTEQASEVTTPDTGQEAVTPPAKEPTERQEPKEQTAEQENEKKEAQEQIAAMDAEAQEEAAIEAEELAPVDSAELFPEAMAAPSSTTMYLTVPSIGLYDIPVMDDISEVGLSQGAGHLPGTGFPWIPGSNTYIAGHRLGYPGTASDQVFYNLPSLGVGDEVMLTDGNGQSYTYAVSEVLEVSPTDLSVTAPVPGRDVVTLQTCIENFGDYWTPGPAWLARYVVRADRV